MSAKIRLARAGAKKKPFYRVVVTDSRNKRDGSFIEMLGTYDPMQKATQINLKLERLQYWLGCGVQTSPTVARIIKEHNLATPVAEA